MDNIVVHNSQPYFLLYCFDFIDYLLHTFIARINFDCIQLAIKGKPGNASLDNIGSSPSLCNIFQKSLPQARLICHQRYTPHCAIFNIQVADNMVYNGLLMHDPSQDYMLIC